MERPGVIGDGVDEQVEPPLPFSVGTGHPEPQGSHEFEAVFVVALGPEGVQDSPQVVDLQVDPLQPLDQQELRSVRLLRDRILDTLGRCTAMARDGELEHLADGQADNCYQGTTQVTGQLDQLIGDHLAFAQLLLEILAAAARLTPGEIHAAFTGFTDRPMVRLYLDLGFPHSPPSLQNVIVNTLLQLGIEPKGPPGHQLFYPPAEVPKQR